LFNTIDSDLISLGWHTIFKECFNSNVHASSGTFDLLGLGWKLGVPKSFNGIVNVFSSFFSLLSLFFLSWEFRVKKSIDGPVDVTLSTNNLIRIGKGFQVIIEVSASALDLQLRLFS